MAYNIYMKAKLDTPKYIENKQIDMLRKAGFEFRFQKTISLSEEVFRLSWNGLKIQNPNLSEKQLKALFVKNLYNIDINENEFLS